MSPLFHDTALLLLQRSLQPILIGQVLLGASVPRMAPRKCRASAVASTSTAAIQAGDQWSAGNLYLVESSLDDPGL